MSTIRSYSLVFMLTALVCNSFLHAQVERTFSITPDRENAIYECGDIATITINMTSKESIPPGSSVTIKLDDFLNPVESVDKKSEFEFVEGTINQIKVTSTTPRFVRCIVSVQQQGKKPVNTISAVAFSPEKIAPSLKVPEDFEQFWTNQKETLAKIKMDPNLVEIKQSDSSIKLFDIKVACVDGVPVSGYFAKPSVAEKESLPAILWVHGAGVRSASKANAKKGAAAGFLSLDINAHGIENGQPNEFYSSLSGGRLRGYRHQGRNSRDTIYFRGMFLRLVRAIDFLTAQPEWNGKHVVVVGHSQGGGQALAAGGLDKPDTMIAAGVPALCDHSGRVVDRINGWPKIVPMDQTGKPDAQVLTAARYYDGVNFASICKAEAVMSVGFIDAVCPPPNCYAACNQLTGKKEMIPRPKMAHAAPQDIQAAFFDRILKHVGKR